MRRRCRRSRCRRTITSYLTRAADRNRSADRAAEPGHTHLTTMRKMSRRELARLAGALTAARAVPAAAQTPARSNYIGPLTGVTSGLDGRQFDPVVYTRERYSAAPRRLRFQARTRADAEAWQQTLRTKLTELVGGFPPAPTPLRPALLESRTFPGYTREKIVFDSRAGVS